MKAGAAQPLLSAKFLARTQRHEEVSRAIVGGRSFVVLKQVFSPKYFGSTEIFTRYLSSERLGKFLEIGSGTGATACSVVMNGAATSAVCTDINKHAVANTMRNINLHGLSGRMTAIHSDLFRRVPQSKFDAIYWNSPFINSRFMRYSSTTLERCLYDPGYRKHTEFFLTAGKYLAPGGSVYLGFGDFADEIAIRGIFRRTGWKVVNRQSSASSEIAAVRFDLLQLKPAEAC